MKPPLPILRCRGWVDSRGRAMPCATGGVIQPGEPGGREEWGECSACTALEAKARKAAYWRGQREAHRRLMAHKPDPADAGWEQVQRGK